ncbi:MAG: hypothetical protein A2654_01705 [Candidatus Nealsonbacteria bacterium RIFCSPHIGHO2_01_FULL_43_31]|uniref:Uncharacterized protein n=2 Tax=Candidatus Nealsoniibacteriota TaxID=1817911 RepID=A0A1G2E930_9BACT|nr:hypothetical protein [uncultured bacterium]OGZ19707.1 MAG: hypothetical protein A2654_01705 [Candidatus Nealsonbacteria bacterium RIFCSPHIGHO2_01_FULL_43_31]OGZ22315.1 MAG: hypothetical protein A3D46_02825 [Candidatus Nealsonbacteria bacterium RIFCSPHIGHO2_02_FULL_43_13]
MRLFLKKTDKAEQLFRAFTSGLENKGFDLKVFDKKQIKKYLGRGMYHAWKESLEALHYRKIIIIFEERDARISWPSDNYLDRLVINIVRVPDRKVLLEAEKELLDLLAIGNELS